MNNLPYRIWRRVGLTYLGTNEQWNVQLIAKAKRSSENPCEVGNELLALRLGLIIGLPIPAGMPAAFEGNWYWASMTVAPGMDSLPIASDADITKILENTRLACGIIAFDSWIMNEDRWRKNLSYDDDTGETFVFDHGRAFHVESRKELIRRRNRICIGNHCLCNIRSLEAFDEWHNRILEIPDRYIYESVKLASQYGLPESEVNFLTETLLLRRVRLSGIFQEHKRYVFPNLNRSLFDEFTNSADHYQI